MKHQRWIVLASLVWTSWPALTPAGSLAQPPAQTVTPTAVPEAVTGDVVDVRVVNVEIVVTDRRGRRVEGLKPGDFRLEVDGQPVPVEYFTEVREGKAAPAAAPPPSSPSAPAAMGPASALPAGLEPGGTIGTNYLVFVDDFFAIKSQRDVVLRSLRKQLDQLGPADHMSVVSWDGRRLSRLASWSASRPALEKAVDQAMARPALGLAREVQFKKFLGEAALQTRDDARQDDINFQIHRMLGGGPGLNLLEVSYGRLVADEVGSATRAVVAALRGADAPEGRKVLLLLSGGWPFTIQSFIQGDELPHDIGKLPLMAPGLQVLANTANLLGYTIYPVDVPGVRSMTRDVQENPMEGHTSYLGGGSTANQLEGGTPTQMTRDAPVAGEFSFSRLTPIRDQELRASVFFLAQETGGRPLLAGNRESALSMTNDDTRSYYWLGFSPSWPRDGRIHKISARVLRDGLQTRSRKGFLDLTTGASATMRFESALLYGELPSTEKVVLHLGEPVKGARRGVTEVPVSVDIPTQALTLLPAEDGRYKGRAQLRFAATDDEGNQSLIPVLDLQLASPKAPSEGGAVRYQTRVFLRGKVTHLAVAVFDPLTGKISAGKTDVQIP